jgi:hypothetical protein
LASKDFQSKNECLVQHLKEFVFHLWDNPKIMYNIIISSDSDALKNNIFPLLINNFYENLFSSNIIENKLLYIIIMLINREIVQISSLNEKGKFLESEIINLFLSELIKKIEIQNYFKLIIQDVINEINKISNENNKNENNDYIADNKLNLDVLSIEKIINNAIEDKENINNNKKDKSKKSIYMAPLRESRLSERESNLQKVDEEDIKKYFDDITKNILQEKSTNNETNQNIKDYCLYQIKIMDDINKNDNTNMEIYSNQNILKNVYKSSISSKILNVYQKFFSIVIESINLLLKKIKENIIILPSSLKIVCKAITLLIKKKFGENNLTSVESIFFFGKFLFGKVLLKFMQCPEENKLLNNLLLLTQETYFNLDIISLIFNKFYSGTFFTQYDEGGNLTPFNGYFLDKIDEIYKIYEEITNINLPQSIQELIDSGNLNDFEYKFNYFDEYKNEFLYHESCCISLNDLFPILSTINSKNSLFFDSDEKFKDYYENLINKNNFKNITNMELPNFFINDNKDKDLSILSKTITDNMSVNASINSNIEYIIINRIAYNKKNFQKNKYDYTSFNIFDKNEINEFEEKKEEENTEENNKLFINKIKTMLCQVLYNTPYLDYMINNYYIKSESLNDFLLILSDIKIYQSFIAKHKTSNNIKYYFPYEFSMNFLMNNIKNLSSNYSDNNYELFINELKNETNESLKCIKFDEISQFYNNFNFLEIKQEINQKYLSKLLRIKIYKKTKKIIEEAHVFIKIKVTNGGGNQNNFDNMSIDIKQSTSNAKKMKTSNDLYIDLKKNIIIFKTIESFSRNFSFETNINFFILEYLKHLNDEEKDIFSYISKIKFNEKLFDFFNKDLRHILTENGFLDNYDKTIINNIMSKIYNYFLNYLYDSIYSFLPSQKDKEFNMKTNRLIWTKLSNFIKTNANLYECIIQRIIQSFIRLEKSKIPSEKYFFFKEIVEISQIFPCEEKIKYFNKIKEKEVLLDSIILYGIIKAKPNNIISDIKYVHYFIQDKNNLVEEYFDLLLPSYILYINELDHTYLYGVNQDTFTVNCNQYEIFNQQ